MLIDPRTAHALESSLADVPGVLGAVVLEDDNEPTRLEVQVFVQQGADVAHLRGLLERVAAGVTDRVVEVVPLEVAGPGPVPEAVAVRGREAVAVPDPEAPAAADGCRPRGRPRLVSVVIDSSVSDDRHEARVSLQDATFAGGRAVAGRDPLMAVVAAACDALAGAGQETPEPRAVQRVTVDGLDVVVVVVTVRGRPLVGSAVLEDEPEPAAVVRATLDAVNRWYGLG